MTYAPPLIKPPLPPLRPPVAPPYRPPGTNPLPPPQTAPIYQPPDLSPPTSLDLKGIVCIYSNAPIWEPKKIRYRYPGENWQEIAGNRFATKITEEYNTVDGVPYIVYMANWSPPRKDWGSSFPVDPVYGVILGMRVINGYHCLVARGGKDIRQVQQVFSHPGPIIRKIEKKFDDTPVDKISKCLFQVFNIFNQEILSITRDDCPEVIVVPERCYFKPENERLVARVIQSLLDPPLRVKYQGHCATVWKDSWPLNYFPVQIYKECSDNPNCPPPRIRFDKKCEETCEQCPPGTAIKVLLGSRIACVDAFGCIKKMIKYKFGCNNYDCICN